MMVDAMTSDGPKIITDATLSVYVMNWAEPSALPCMGYIAVHTVSS